MRDARTLAMIRHLAALGPLTRGRGRLPIQQHPDRIAEEYTRTLTELVVVPTRLSQHERAMILHDLAAHRRGRGRHDAGEDDRVRQVLAEAGRRAAAGMRPHELHAVTEHFGRATSAFQRQQLDRQVRHAMGVPLSAIEGPIRDQIPEWAAQATELVKTVPERYHDRLRADVEDAFTTGMRPETLAERFVELDDMAEWDAERLARDQIGKLAARTNMARQKSIGIKRGVWRSVHDNRCCDDCALLDGTEYDLDDPPEGEGPGHCHPLDRCYQEPVFPEAGGGDDGGDGEDADAEDLAA